LPEKSVTGLDVRDPDQSWGRVPDRLIGRRRRAVRRGRDDCRDVNPDRNAGRDRDPNPNPNDARGRSRSATG